MRFYHERYQKALQDKLQQVEKVCFNEQDRIRALSVHETAHLIEELRAVIAAVKPTSPSCKNLR